MGTVEFFLKTKRSLSKDCAEASGQLEYSSGLDLHGRYCMLSWTVKMLNNSMQR